MPDVQSATVELDEEAIVERIYEAVIDQRLAPGTKLSEAALCEAFGVRRMRIRRSLLLAASREVVELRSNKGAFIARPTAKQARDVFEARLALEPNIARLAVERGKALGIRTLQAHVVKESAARNNGNRREAIRLSGQFHTTLAQIAGNAVMLRMVKDLVTRSSLIIGMFGSSGVTHCRDDEHAGIIDALRSGDGDLAARLMTGHLSHIKEHLHLEAKQIPPTDLIAVFRQRSSVQLDDGVATKT